MINIDKDYLITVDLKNTKVKSDKTIFFYNTDLNICNIFIKLIRTDSDKTIPDDLIVEFAVLKPETDEFKPLDATLISKEDLLYQVDLTTDYLDIIGTYECEIRVSGTIDNEMKCFTSESFDYVVRPNITAKLNKKIKQDKNLPILEKLIKEVNDIGLGIEMNQVQLKRDDNLVGDNKSIVGAINQLREDVNSGGKVELTDYQKKTDDNLATEEKSIVGAVNEINSQCKDIAKKIEQGGTGGGTTTIPDNVVLFQDDDSTETTEVYIPLLSSNGTEYRLTINDSGIPVVKDSSNKVIFTCGTGGSSSGGGSIPPTPETPGEVTSGTPYTLEWTDGKYINENNGKEVAYENYSLSQYIPVVGMDFIYYRNNTSAIQKYNAFYDIDKNFISSYIVMNSDVPIEVPENACYIRFSLKTEYKDKIIVTPFVYTTRTWTDGIAYNLNLIANKYVKVDGSIVNYNDWSMTDYLECGKARKLSITGNTVDTQYCVFFMPDKTVLNSFKVTTDNPCEVIVPVGANYFVISNKTIAMNTITVTPIA